MPTSWITRSELNAVEASLLAAVEFSNPVDAIQPDGSRGDVSADVLFQILTGAGGLGPDFFRSLDLRNAAIVGQFDLSSGKARGPMRFSNCTFGPRVLLDKAVMYSVKMDGCELAAGIQADGAHIDGDVILAGSHLTGPVDDGARGMAMDFYGATITDGIRFQDGFVAEGEVELSGTSIGGKVSVSGSFTNPGGDALSLDRATIAGGLAFRSGFVAAGRVRLLGANVGGQLRLPFGSFCNPEGQSLSLVGATVSRSVFFGRDFASDGKVVLTGATIGGAIDLSGSFRNPGRDALLMDRTNIARSVDFRPNFLATGAVVLSGASIGGAINLSGTFVNPHGDALVLSRTVVDDTLRLNEMAVDGQFNFAHARSQVLELPLPRDAPTTILGGLTYGQIVPGPSGVRVEDRLAWLERDPTHYQPGPYAALAAAYAVDGHEDAARQIRIASQDARYRRARSLGPFWRRSTTAAWGWTKKATVAYGYRPGRAAGWLLGYWIAGSLALQLFWDQFTNPRRIGPPIYFLDQLVPFLDFPQDREVAPRTGLAQVILVVLVAAGLVLVTAAAAGITGALSRSD